MTADVITVIEGRCGRIRVNRPKALHALTHAMCMSITSALLRWNDDPSVAGVMIDHAEGRGFCAGGDIVALSRSTADGGAEARRFFEVEFRLNHLLANYPKPTIAVMDGVTMGGGVGISQPCKVRVATDRTVFAMPETGIGYFPDVGAGRYLSRLPGRLGQYIALTGAKLSGAECVAVGLATHGLRAEKLATVKEEILGTPEDAEAILHHAADLETEEGSAKLRGAMEQIDELFASDRLEDIESRLESDGGDWAREKLSQLWSKSPTACKVALRLLRESSAIEDFADEMRLEYALAARMITRPDFKEGVRALLVDKTNDPRWQPPSIREVDDALVAAIFRPLSPSDAWKPLEGAAS